MKKRIVVMGGSFNPPTIAHFKLMQAAIEAVDARLKEELKKQME